MSEQGGLDGHLLTWPYDTFDTLTTIIRAGSTTSTETAVAIHAMEYLDDEVI